jgi:hypothetical protein
MTILGNVWKQDDPRSNLEKASRYELAQLAKKMGFTDITYDTPQPIQVKMLRARGVTNIEIPDRILGDSRPLVYNTDQVAPAAPKETEAKSMTADELLEAQYRNELSAKEIKEPDEMSMTELRSECKRRGIKMARTDNLKTLREKLGQDAA